MNSVLILGYLTAISTLQRIVLLATSPPIGYCTGLFSHLCSNPNPFTNLVRGFLPRCVCYCSFDTPIPWVGGRCASYTQQ
ncbi:hypothetical protein B0J17DRAFT_306956 [Rhizoctonia solani]|nr:hypothetical protein B0J17DRAFT_306956 [Rhizoctonia solani]